MMFYFLDTEFNGFGGELLSLALVREDGESLYLVNEAPPTVEAWVGENVMPIMHNCPMPAKVCSLAEWPAEIADFFNEAPTLPYVVSDWPDDIRYLCQALITGPGTMAPVARIKFDVVRVNAYPTRLQGAVQHNAWWDAMALREKLLPASPAAQPDTGETVA